MRLFIAVRFSREICSKLGAFMQTMRQACVSGDFTREENLHLTLTFLGERPDGQAGRIVRTMDAAAV